MPLTAFVNGASQLVSGGRVGSFIAVLVVLLVWALIGGALLLSRSRGGGARQPGRVDLGPV